MTEIQLSNSVISKFFRSDFKDSIVNVILERPILKKQGYKYSDLGYYLYKIAIERNKGMQLNEYVDRYFYKQLGASVYTVTPGDIIPDDTGNQYRVMSVEDAGDIDDTFYVFNVQEIKKQPSHHQKLVL